MIGDGVEEIIDQSVENRRFRIRGVAIVFGAILFTTTVVFTVAGISVANLIQNAGQAEEQANGSSDEYQDIRYTLVGGIVNKEYMSEEEIRAEEAKVKELEERKKVEEEAAKKAAEEEKKRKEAAAQKPKPYVPPSGSKIVYLTFDDGPGPYTAQLLDVLKKYDVKATFFVTCNRAQYRNMITRAYNEGHSIGLHSCTHDYSKVYASEDAFFAELDTISNVVKAATGVETKLVRFPGGSSNTVSRKYNQGVVTRIVNELNERGYVYFDWNVSSGDAGNTTSTSKVYDNVIRGLKGNYSIVLQHDIKKFSVDAVERIIQDGKKYGFTFKALDMTSPTAHHRINN
jgi:peptidoglycan/xylan/chitin deacetylase (PgdA/CDA1 family)